MMRRRLDSRSMALLGGIFAVPCVTGLVDLWLARWTFRYLSDAFPGAPRESLTELLGGLVFLTGLLSAIFFLEAWMIRHKGASLADWVMSILAVGSMTAFAGVYGFTTENGHFAAPLAWRLGLGVVCVAAAAVLAQRFTSGRTRSEHYGRPA